MSIFTCLKKLVLQTNIIDLKAFHISFLQFMTKFTPISAPTTIKLYFAKPKGNSKNQDQIQIFNKI
ncbi:hypothetical protein BpHYR1_005964 [Brachionus plicatilis]|uniref:Uncharacterized protein n=1 Tax=Brachionus plicatilis TaxID=10195 RepID=A0A3M7PKV6_BRAPC|nr:hypothetical protein BpHYR1_005964 [Brachionus plicatilis]